MGKINLIIGDLGAATGGIERVITTIIENIDPEAFDVTLVSRDSPAFFRDLKLKPSMRQLKFQLPSSAAGYLHSAKVVKALVELFSNREAVYNPNEFLSLYVGLVAAFFARHKPKILLTMHQFTYIRPLPKYKKALYKLFERIAYRKVDAFITVEGWSKEQLINDFKVPEEKITVIHNGIDVTRPPATDEEKKLIRQEYGIPEDAFVIGYSARLSKEKGAILLLNAIDLLDEPIKSTSYVLLAGDGPERENLMMKAQQLNHVPHLKLLGYVQDIGKLYDALDVLVQPSFEEGLSITILEAMTHGLMVIASNVGGNPEVVAEGETGWLFEKGDAAGLSRLIARAFENKTERDLFGENGRKRVIEQFNSPLMIDKTARLIRATSRRTTR